MGAAIHSRFDAIEERDCPDLESCIGEIHGLMYTAVLSEPTDQFAYALWLEADDDCHPVYIIQKDIDRVGALHTMMTPDVVDLFNSIDEKWWDHVLEVEGECDSP
ncbi:MAG TPA: hypothetical protein VNC22_23315 [Sporichthya sp.]|nr:hypothetical protein [Sporichthya sp.]